MAIDACAGAHCDRDRSEHGAGTDRAGGKTADLSGFTWDDDRRHHGRAAGRAGNGPRHQPALGADIFAHRSRLRSGGRPVIGLAAGLLARAGMFRTPVHAAISGLIIAIVLSFVAVPIRVWMFGGVTGSGADLLTGWLLQTGRDLFSSVLVTVITSNLADKIVTALLAWGVVRGLPLRVVADWPFLSYSRR
ncbi:hypothetical protein ACFPLB_10080 [Aquamicrobium segne]|uniref:Uncharacterized protein n=1 Tax=Aquamicrobium segne TaxID=469547 RepID=A0ABW0H2Q8_9HYPH